MIARVRHIWENVTLSSGTRFGTTGGTITTKDGEYVYRVFSLRYTDGKRVTTFNVWRDGMLVWLEEKTFRVTNTVLEETLLEWLGRNALSFVRFNDYDTVYEDRIGTAADCVESCWLKRGGRMELSDEMADPVLSSMGDGKGDNDTEEKDDRRREEGLSDGPRVAEMDSDCCDGDRKPEQTPAAQEKTKVQDGKSLWEIWLWHGSLDIDGSVPDMIVYGGKRLSDKDEALCLWKDCRTSHPDDPMMLVEIQDNRLKCVCDLHGFVVSIGTGVDFSSSL